MIPRPPPVDRRDRRLALLLALLAFLVYNANFHLIAAGDSYPARFIPFGLWGYGTVYLDPIREVTAQSYPQPYWIQPTHRGVSASLYPVVTPLLVAPLYGPAVLYLQVAGWSYENMSRVGAIMEKVAASLVASGAVFLMFFALRRRVERRDALLLTAAFALGTATWSVSSQALWQHGPAELMVAAGLWLMTGAPTRGNALAAGLAAGLLAANRPPDVLIAAAFSLYALAWARGRAALFALAAAVPVVLVLAYNLVTFENLSGGYGAIGVLSTRFFANPLLPGIAGLLVSPGRGLLLFCPFLLFLPLLFHRGLRDREHRLLTLLLAGAAALQVVLYARADWRGGYSFGPRFLTDLMPVLVWMLAPVLASLGRPARALFLACCLFAVWVQAVGAFQFSGASFAFQYTPPPGPGEMKNVWKWRDPAFLMEARNPRQSADLLDTLQSLAHPVAPRPIVRIALPVEYPRRVPATARATPRVSPASDFYTVASCVLVDTRAGAPLRRGDAPRKLKIAGTGCAIPASAVALVGWVSILEGSEPGSVLLFPEGTGRGALELSFGEGGPRDFSFILPLAHEAGGAVTVTTTSSGAHLLVHTSGYFAPGSAAESR
jgi:hypothetical protein